MSDLPDLKPCGYCWAKPEVIYGRSEDYSDDYTQVICRNIDCPHQPSTDCYTGPLQVDNAFNDWNNCDILKTKDRGIKL